MEQNWIRTERLNVVPCDPETLQCAVEGNAVLAQKLSIEVPEQWTEFGVDALTYAKDKLSGSAEESGWWTYLPILRNANKLVGSGGYKGKPDVDGVVEIGYEIAPDQRNQGLATELAQGLCAHAFRHPTVTAVIAHTLGEENASTRVLTHCGFEKVEELKDPDEGTIWKWELKRAG